MLLVVSSCTTKNDLERQGLHGNVKLITENHFEAEKKSETWQKGIPTKYGSYSVAFDSDGNYIWTTYFDEKSELTRKVVLERELGKVVSEKGYDKDGELVGSASITYVSDTETLYKSYKKGEGQTSESKTFYENDQVKRQEIEIFIDLDRSIKLTSIYSYDENRNVSTIHKTQSETDQEDIVTTTTYKYTEFDKNNNWTKRLDYTVETPEIPANIAIRTYKYFE